MLFHKFILQLWIEYSKNLILATLHDNNSLMIYFLFRPKLNEN